jgi:hypothetical protein
MHGALLLAFLSCAWALDFWPITALSHNDEVFVLYACFPEGNEWYDQQCSNSHIGGYAFRK